MDLFTTPAVEALTSPGGWLAAMLEFEKALAEAHESLGMVPPGAGAAIAAACDPGLYDLPAMRDGALASATPAVPIVEALRQHVGPEHASFVHLGATSQDVVDTAMMLIARRVVAACGEDFGRIVTTLAALAEEHRATLMVGRTLLQPATPITFGLKCATWLDGIIDAEDRLRRLAAERFPVQLGGAVGTLATYAGHGPALVEALATRLGLVAPDLPWHTNRTRLIEAAAAFAALAAAAGKVGGDIVLLSQPEVGELGLVPGSGGRSSAMPHKANPARAVLAVAAASQASAYAAALLTLPQHEHERAAGAWQAEWQPLSLILRTTAAAMWHVAAALEAMTVRPAAMLRNLDAMRGLPMAESLAAALAPQLGAGAARECVERLCRLAVERETSLLAEASKEPGITSHLSADAIGRALDPAACLGSTGTFIDRALAGAARREAN